MDIKAFLKQWRFTLILVFSVLLDAAVGALIGPKSQVLKPFGDVLLNLLFTAVVPLIFFHFIRRRLQLQSQTPGSNCRSDAGRLCDYGHYFGGVDDSGGQTRRSGKRAVFPRVFDIGVSSYGAIDPADYALCADRTGGVFCISDRRIRFGIGGRLFPCGYLVLSGSIAVFWCWP